MNHQCQQCQNCYSIELPTSVYCSQCARKLTIPKSDNNHQMLNVIGVIASILCFCAIISAFVLTAPRQNTPSANSDFTRKAALNSEPVSVIENSTPQIISGEVSNIPDVAHKHTPKPLPSLEPESDGESIETELQPLDQSTQTYAPVSWRTPEPEAKATQPEESRTSLPPPRISVSDIYSRPIPPSPIYPTYPRTEQTTSPTETGAAVTAQCSDGTFSYSANNSGTCSHHGGVATTTRDTASPSTPSYSSSSGDTSDRPKTVQVSGYTRKDGTYVAPYSRSAPRRH